MLFSPESVRPTMREIQTGDTMKFEPFVR